jgi:AAA family ATP:ADP antiporter
MLLYLFLIICALLIVKPTVNALFLSEQGADSLALAFIITAIVAVVVSYLYNKSLEKYPLRRTIRGTLTLFSVGFFVMGICVTTGFVPAFLAYIFYIGVGMFALLATSQFWVMANVVYNVREAKRLFGFIGAGGIIGGIAGGYLTSLTAQYLGNGVLIMIAAVMIAGCGAVFQKIWKDRVSNLTQYKRKERAGVSSESSMKLIWDSKHLTYLAALIGLGVLVAKLVDYQFSLVAHREIPDPQELASFFGFWFSTFNIVSLLIQLFVTRRILERTDVGVGLVLLPVGLFCCCFLLLIFPELWLVVLLKGLDGSLKQSLHKSSVELLSLPIPSTVKNKTKTFIDVVVDSVATGIAGFFIVFIVKGLDLPMTAITALTILLLALWVFMVFKVRETYLGTFRDSIASTEHLKLSKASAKQIRKNMRVIFETGSAKDILQVLERLPEVAHSSLGKNIIELLNHPDNKVKAAAVRSLDLVTKTTQPQVQDLIYERDDDLIVAVMEYLIAREATTYQFFEHYLDDEDEFISTAALLALAKDARDNPKLASKYNLGLRVNLFIHEIESSDNDLKIPEIAHLIRALGYVTRTKYHEIIGRYLKHPNPILKTAAIEAAGEMAHEKFLPHLVACLEEFRFRESAIKAIIKYGNSIIPLIEKGKGSTTENHVLQIYVPEILAGLRTQRSYRALLRVAQNGGARQRTKATELLYDWRKSGDAYPVRMKSLRRSIENEISTYKNLLSCYYSLRIIQRSASRPDSNVVSLPEKEARQHLINQLHSSMEMALKRTFNLLALYYDPNDVFIAYKGLKSDVQDSKLNAIEYMDGLIARNLKTILFPILENGFIHPEEVKDYHAHVDLKKQDDCYDFLTDIPDRDVHLRLIALLKLDQEQQSMQHLIHFSEDVSQEISDAANEAILYRNKQATA